MRVEEYDIYIRSFSAKGIEPADEGLERIFGIEPMRARELIRSLPRIVKRHVPAEEVARYEQALRELSADYELRRSPIRPVPTIAVLGQAPTENPSLQRHGSTLTLPPPSLKPARAPTVKTEHATAPRSTRLDSDIPMPATVAAGPDHWGVALQDTLIDPVAPRDAAPARTVPNTAAIAQVPPAHEHPASIKAPDPQPTAGVWTSIEPAPFYKPAEGELPQPWEVPGLQLDGRPDWLEDGLHGLGAADGIEPIATDLGTGSSRPPSTAPAAQEDRGRPASLTPHPLGNVIGRELARDEPSALLRLLVRVGIGVSLFVIVATVRHVRVFDRAVDQALASWNDPASGEPTTTSQAPKPTLDLDNTGPDALSWMDSDLHQFTDGDKDRVRDLVRRFRASGARAVRVNRIMHSGAVQIAAELVVTMPEERAARNAVLGEYHHFLQGTFGEFAAAPQDPGGDLLRVAL